MTLQYNKENDRYNNFNCGDCFKIKIKDKWTWVRIEQNGNNQWYLIDENDFTCICSRLEGSEIKLPYQNSRRYE